MRFPHNCQLRPFEERLGKHHVFTLAGVSRHSVCHDALHALYTKGALGHSVGSFLYELCWADHGRQAVNPKTRLEWIFKRVQQIYGQLGVHPHHRMNMLKLSMFVQEDSPHQSAPNLRTKGGEMKHLVPVIAQIAKEVGSGSNMDGIRADMFSAIGALCEMQSVIVVQYIVLLDWFNNK